MNEEKGPFWFFYHNDFYASFPLNKGNYTGPGFFDTRTALTWRGTKDNAPMKAEESDTPDAEPEMATA